MIGSHKKIILFLLLWNVAMGSVSSQERSPQKIVFVFKTHFDIGYTDLASRVIEQYKTTTIDKALDTCDRSRSLPPEKQFVWTIPGWPMAQILSEDQTPERHHRVFEAMQQGRFTVHALPFSLHTESLEPEDIVRGLSFSSRLARLAGFDLPRDAKMTDVPSHSWILPTLLKHAGVDFLHLGCNPASASPDVPMLFWWEGPDGSRLLTMYSSGDYGSSLSPPDDWPYQTWLALIHTGDNHGPPTADSITTLLDDAHTQFPHAEITIGRLSDFGDAILKENPTLPIVRGDMPDTWIHGLNSMPVETKSARNIRPAIAAAEALDTLLSVWGVPVASTTKDIAYAYEQSLLFGEHTWGMNTSKFGKRLYGDAWKQERSQGTYERLERSWQEKGAYILNVEKRIQPLLQSRLNLLAQSVHTEGERIVVFNPLPWPRTGVVELEWTSSLSPALREVSSGKTIPSDCHNSLLRFMAEDIPSFGYRTYSISNDNHSRSARSDLAFDRSTNTLENRFYKIRLDPHSGGLASVVYKPANRELVDIQSTYGFGQYLYERFSQDNVDSYLDAYLKIRPDWAFNDLGKPGLPPSKEAPYTQSRGCESELNVHQGDTSITATLRYGNGATDLQKVEVAVTLYRHHPYWDIAWTIHNKEADPWPEAGWLSFPLAIPNPQFRMARLGAILDPANDIIRSANHDVFCLDGGLAVIGADGTGVGLCPLDSPLVSLGRPGLWRYSRDYVADTSSVFVNLFNNIWSTNFQQWIDGSWTSRVRVWAFDAYHNTESLSAPSMEGRSPLLAGVGHGAAGTLPPTQSGVELSRAGVAVTAFGPNPDGDGLLLRLWEQSGNEGPCTIRIPAGLKLDRVQSCNVRGESRGTQFPVAHNQWNVQIDPYTPYSFLLHERNDK